MIDADLAFLLARYGRVSAAEMAVFTLVWQATEGRGRTWARMSPRIATEDAPALGDYLGIHPRAAARTLRLLYADGHAVDGRRSHNLLRRLGSEDRSLPRGSRAVPSYAVNTSWRTWGWSGKVDLDAIERDRRRLVGPLPAGSWSHTAEALAADLAERMRLGGAAAPPLDLEDLTFRRWCRTVQRLLDAFSDDDVRAALIFAAADPYWAHRIAGYDADRNIAAVIHLFPTRKAPQRSAA